MRKVVEGKICDVCQLFHCLGDVTVEVIEQCRCQGSCYRMSYWESYFERTTDVRGHIKDVERVRICMYVCRVVSAVMAGKPYKFSCMCMCD